MSDFIEFCRTTGSEAIVTVNYAAARYWSVEKAADLAARWVHYFNVEKKFKVRYWEVGNEVHGNWEEGNKVLLARATMRTLSTIARSASEWSRQRARRPG